MTVKKDSMQKLLIGLITSLLEKYVIGFIKKANKYRLDRKMLKDIRKDDDAKNRAKRLKDFINK